MREASAASVEAKHFNNASKSYLKTSPATFSGFITAVICNSFPAPEKNLKRDAGARFSRVIFRATNI